MAPQISALGVGAPDCVFTTTHADRHLVDIGEQGRLLDAVAELVNDSRIRTTATDMLAPINAANLVEAHRCIDSATTRGKIVLEGWGAQQA